MSYLDTVSIFQSRPFDLDKIDDKEFRYHLMISCNHIDDNRQTFQWVTVVSQIVLNFDYSEVNSKINFECLKWSTKFL